jgi:NAD(P)-dependent dehydrogenase (short-subunit alcohol dehydrogenase family)
MSNLTKRRVLVTGASSGIGRAIAIELAKEGCEVAVLDVNEPVAERWQNDCRCRFDLFSGRCSASFCLLRHEGRSGDHNEIPGDRMDSVRHPDKCRRTGLFFDSRDQSYGGGEERINLRAIEKRTRRGRMAEPEEIAEAVVYLCGAGHVTGQAMTVDGGWTAYGHL